MEKHPNKEILVCGHKNFLTCLEIAIKKNKIQDYYSCPSFKNGEMKSYNL